MRNDTARPFVDTFDRHDALHTPEATSFLHALPNDIRETFVQCFLASDVCSPGADSVRQHLLDNAETPKIVRADTTSSITFEWLYRKRPARTPLDAYFPQSEAGRQIYQRYVALKHHLAEIVKHEHQTEPLLVDNIGSGPGHDWIDMLAENPELAQRVFVRNIDPDTDALSIGQTRVNDLGLSARFVFVESTLQESDSVGADIVSLIGILCPQSMSTSRLFLKQLKRFMKPGGLIVYGTAQTRMRRDPLCDWVMRLYGWHMDHKTDEEAWQLALDVQLEPFFQFFDFPYRHHCMTVARYPK